MRGIEPRPGRECEHSVEQHGSGRAGQQARVPAGKSGEALAEEPHPERPWKRGGEREPGGARDQQPEPEQQLDSREGHIQGDRMGRDEARAPLDRSGDKIGLPGCGRGDDLPREAGAKHEGLELQRAVQQPQQPQRDLQVAAGDSTSAEREGCVHFSLSGRVAWATRPGSDSYCDVSP